MGFFRKGLFVGTGGLSGLAGVRANSKKERTAKAAERQVRLQQEMRKSATASARPTAPPAVPSEDSANSGVAIELDRVMALHESGALTDDEFAAAKTKILAPEKQAAREQPPPPNLLAQPEALEAQVLAAFRRGAITADEAEYLERMARSLADPTSPKLLPMNQIIGQAPTRRLRKIKPSQLEALLNPPR